MKGTDSPHSLACGRVRSVAIADGDNLFTFASLGRIEKCRRHSEVNRASTTTHWSNYFRIRVRFAQKDKMPEQ